jgi:hypothetical protein
MRFEGIYHSPHIPEFGRRRQEEREQLMPRVVDAGPVGNVFMPEASLADKQAAGIWKGNISLFESVEHEPGFLERVEAATTPERLNENFRAADLSAPARCIDGRIIDGWLEDRRLQERSLGPQTAGGTPVTALIYQLIARGKVGGPNMSFQKDLTDVVEILGRNGIFFGGHIDEHNEAHPENTGCGAIDRFPEILAQNVVPEALREINALSQILLPENYDYGAVTGFVGRLLLLRADREQYLGYDPQNDTYAYKHIALDVMRQSASPKNPVEKLVGPHNEKGLIINTVEGTTFDRDAFSHENHNEIQLFNYDAWFTNHVAKVLYPDSEKNQQEYIIGRTMYALATAMVLTDGSPKLFIRDEV